MNTFSKITCLVFFALLSFNVSAQFKIGAKVGVNIASQTVPSDFDVNGFDSKSITGYLFGGVLEIGLNNLIAVQPEVLFYQKGSKLEVDFAGDMFENTATINYLEIPILLKVNFGDAESTRFFALAGPSFGYAVSGTIDDGTDKIDIDFDRDEISRFDLGLALGAGVAIPAGPGRFVVDLRYLLGLSNVDDSGDNDLETMNRGIGISLGYLLAIGE